jgi:hypothetical protein
MAPIAQAISIDFDNLISSPRPIIAAAFDRRTTQRPACRPSRNPFVHAMSRVLFKLLFGARVYSALRLEHFAAKHATRIAENLSTFIAVAKAMNGRPPGAAGEGGAPSFTLETAVEQQRHKGRETTETPRFAFLDGFHPAGEAKQETLPA